MITWENLAKIYDHSILEPTATKEATIRMCNETLENGFASTYVHPCYVSLAKSIQGDKAKVGTVIGFPNGGSTTKIKVAEALDAIDNGANKVDIVWNISKFKSGDYNYVSDELKELSKAVKEKDPNVVVTIIVEACYLTHDEKINACEIVAGSGADFIKTSTGFGTGGCRIGDIRLMKKTLKGRIKVKAAAEIKSIEDAMAVIDEGVDVIGENFGMVFKQDFDKQVWFDK